MRERGGGRGEEEQEGGGREGGRDERGRGREGWGERNGMEGRLESRNGERQDTDKKDGSTYAVQW